MESEAAKRQKHGSSRKEHSRQGRRKRRRGVQKGELQRDEGVRFTKPSDEGVRSPDTDLFGFELRLVVPMPQTAVLAQAPGVELSADQDGGAVRAAARDVLHALALEELNQLGRVAVPVGKSKVALST